VDFRRFDLAPGKRYIRWMPGGPADATAVRRPVTARTEGGPE
jgi:hypothetical protein